jgi:hypothetical protein
MHTTLVAGEPLDTLIEALAHVGGERRRGREWISDELFQLLDAFEQDLGE